MLLTLTSRHVRRLATFVLLLATHITAQADENQTIQRIAFGSCADQNLPQPIWEAVAEAKPDLFVLLGDNIYGDSDDVDVLRAKYHQFDEVPGFRALKQSVPVLGTWDDHDYGRNDAGVEYPKKVGSQQAFLDFLGEPEDSPRRKRAGVYDAKVFGPEGKRVQLILLDTRYHRTALKKRPKQTPTGVYDPTDDPAATMLGDEQWSWLEEQLRQPAELRILASSIQVVPDDHGWEKWGNMPRERQRLFDLIRDTKASGVVFISGDRHLAELSVVDGGAGYPLFDVTSRAHPSRL